MKKKQNNSGKTKIESSKNEESSCLSDDAVKRLTTEMENECKKITLIRKIDILSRYLANPNNEFIFASNSFAMNIINEFISTYPNRDDHAEGLDKLCEEYYSLY